MSDVYDTPTFNQVDEMSDDLIKRLRGWDHCWPAQGLEDDVAKAADLIEQLERERDYTEGTNDVLIAENQRLEAKLAKVTAAFRVMLMRLHEGYTHEAFDAYIAEMVGKE